MKKYIEIKNQGVFYNVYNEDAYIMYSLTNYRLTNGRLGFPKNSIDRIKNILEENKINYIIIDDDIVEEKQFKRNSYNRYLKLGTKLYEQQREKDSLLKNINKLSNDDIKKVNKYVNYIIYK